MIWLGIAIGLGIGAVVAIIGFIRRKRGQEYVNPLPPIDLSPKWTHHEPIALMAAVAQYAGDI